MGYLIALGPTSLIGRWPTAIIFFDKNIFTQASIRLSGVFLLTTQTQILYFCHLKSHCMFLAQFGQTPF